MIVGARAVLEPSSSYYSRQQWRWRRPIYIIIKQQGTWCAAYSHGSTKDM